MTKGYYYQLRKAYVDIFNGALIDGQQIGVYDYVAPDDAPLPYVIIGDMSSNDRDNKGNDTENTSVTIQIVNSYNGQGGRKVVDEIGDTLMNIKDNLNTEIGGALFMVHEVRKINDLTQFQQSPTAKVYRRIITLGHIIEQIN